MVLLLVVWLVLFLVACRLVDPAPPPAALLAVAAFVLLVSRLIVGRRRAWLRRGHA